MRSSCGHRLCRSDEPISRPPLMDSAAMHDELLLRITAAAIACYKQVLAPTYHVICSRIVYVTNIGFACCCIEHEHEWIFLTAYIGTESFVDIINTPNYSC